MRMIRSYRALNGGAVGQGSCGFDAETRRTSQVNPENAEEAEGRGLGPSASYAGWRIFRSASGSFRAGPGGRTKSASPGAYASQRSPQRLSASASNTKLVWLPSHG